MSDDSQETYTSESAGTTADAGGAELVVPSGMAASEYDASSGYDAGSDGSV
jgi:hypothetical protein